MFSLRLIWSAMFHVFGTIFILVTLVGLQLIFGTLKDGSGQINT